MALLDFIKNRNQTVSAPANEQGSPAPETYKQSMTRLDAEEKASRPSVENMSVDQKAKAQAVGEKLSALPTEPDPATATTPAPSSAPAPTSGTDNQQPMQQIGMGQSKAAPDLSPTSAQMGMKEADQTVTPSPTPTPAPARPPRSMFPDF